MTTYMLFDPLLKRAPNPLSIELLCDADKHVFCNPEVCVRNDVVIVPVEREAEP